MWSTEEDTALVQFVALHKDQQATEVEWPAMKALHEYWYNAEKETLFAMFHRYLGPVFTLKQFYSA